MMFQRFSACCLLATACLLPAYLRAQDASGGQSDQTGRYASEGQAALAAGRYTEARADFEQLSKLHPEVAEVHATLAAIYFKLRQYDLAVESIHSAQKLKPGLPHLDSLLGLSLAEMARYSQALPHLEKGFKQTAD